VLGEDDIAAAEVVGGETPYYNCGGWHACGSQETCPYTPWCYNCNSRSEWNRMDICCRQDGHCGPLPTWTLCLFVHPDNATVVIPVRPGTPPAIPPTGPAASGGASIRTPTDRVFS